MKVKITFLLFFICSSYVFAQNDVNMHGTSIDLYNYAVKGYAYQKKMGLTTSKEGYDIKHIHTYSHPNNINLTVDYIGLYKTGAKIPQAVIIIANKNSTLPQYLCMPHPNTGKNVTMLCDKTIALTPETRLRLYFHGFQDLYMSGKLKNYIEERKNIALKEIGWTKEIRAEFLKYCKNEIHPHSEASKEDADIICYCLLGKVMKKYKTLDQTKGITNEAIQMANECAK